jgi:hypothetical protein
MKVTKQIPFDWKTYQSDKEKYQVVTKDGNLVKQLTMFEETDSYYSLRGVLGRTIENWTTHGKFFYSKEDERDLLLQFEEEVVDRWVNIYETKYGEMKISNRPLPTKEAALHKLCVTCEWAATINLNDIK